MHVGVRPNPNRLVFSLKNAFRLSHKNSKKGENLSRKAEKCTSPFFKTAKYQSFLGKEVQKWPKMLLAFLNGKIAEFRDVDMNKFKKEKQSRH